MAAHKTDIEVATEVEGELTPTQYILSSRQWLISPTNFLSQIGRSRWS